MLFGRRALAPMESFNAVHPSSIALGQSRGQSCVTVRVARRSLGVVRLVERPPGAAAMGPEGEPTDDHYDRGADLAP